MPVLLVWIKMFLHGVFICFPIYVKFCTKMNTTIPVNEITFTTAKCAFVFTTILTKKHLSRFDFASVRSTRVDM